MGKRKCRGKPAPKAHGQARHRLLLPLQQPWQWNRMQDVDHVIKDEKTKSAYELLDVYCELIIQRLHMGMPNRFERGDSNCSFCRTKCADVPKLSDVTKQFQAKYGKEFITSALELRPGSGASTLVVDKLAASSSNIETKVKVLKSIAEENNVKWEAKGFEEEKKVLQPQMARLYLQRLGDEWINSTFLHLPQPTNYYMNQVLQTTVMQQMEICNL